MIESLEDTEMAALEAARKFLDTVNRQVQDLNGDDGPCRQIIDSAFTMTEESVGTSNDLLQRIFRLDRT